MCEEFEDARSQVATTEKELFTSISDGYGTVNVDLLGTMNAANEKVGVSCNHSKWRIDKNLSLLVTYHVSTM